MTEPNLNSQIVDIINNFLQENKLVDARTCEGEFLGMHSSLTVGGANEVVEELEALISDQVAKAREELEDALYNHKKTLDYIVKDGAPRNPTNYEVYLRKAIEVDQKLATLKGVKNRK